MSRYNTQIDTCSSTSIVFNPSDANYFFSREYKKHTHYTCNGFHKKQKNRKTKRREFKKEIIFLTSPFIASR